MQHLEPRRPQCHALPPQLERPNCICPTHRLCARVLRGAAVLVQAPGQRAGAERACLPRRRLLKAYPNDWQVWLAREGGQPECIATQVRTPSCRRAGAECTTFSSMWGRQFARDTSSTVALGHCRRNMIAGFHVMRV